MFFAGTVSQPGEVALLARRFDRALVLYNIGTQPATYRLPGDVAYGHVRMVPFQGTLSPMETRMRPAPLCLASEGLDVEAVDACLLRGERCDVTCRPPTVAETASDGGTSGAWRSESRFAPLLALEGYARGTDIQLEPAEVVLLITPAALDRTGAYYVDRMNMTGHALAKRTPAPERAIVAGRSPSAKLGDAVLP